jgi:hypothetical protein
MLIDFFRFLFFPMISNSFSWAIYKIIFFRGICPCQHTEVRRQSGPGFELGRTRKQEKMDCKKWGWRLGFYSIEKAGSDLTHPCGIVEAPSTFSPCKSQLPIPPPLLERGFFGSASWLELRSTHALPRSGCALTT